MIARYDAVADAYASAGDDYEGHAVAALLALVGEVRGHRALDLACGHGPLARELARRGAHVTAVDISQSLIDHARVQLRDEMEPIEYIHGSATDRSLLSGNQFDIVVCNFGLSDIDDLDGACEVVRQSLVVGGKFIFSILHPCFGGASDVSASWPTGRTYYDEGFWRADGERSTLRRQVGANHRTLGTYSNTLVRNRLAIDVISEPPAEPSWAETRPGAGDQPVYLVVQCIRI